MGLTGLPALAIDSPSAGETKKQKSEENSPSDLQMTTNSFEPSHGSADVLASRCTANFVASCA
jgi:hypothetical protein